MIPAIVVLCSVHGVYDAVYLCSITWRDTLAPHFFRIFMHEVLPRCVPSLGSTLTRFESALRKCNSHYLTTIASRACAL